MAHFLASFGAELWHVSCDMAPFLLFGFLLAGFLAVLVPAAAVERHLGRPGLLSVLKATVLGVPLPLCSCGVIPVAASLRRHGAGKGATTAFLISTPQIGVDSVLVTLSLLGPLFAVFKVATAVVSGMLAGLAAEVFSPVGAGEELKTPCADACCVPRPGQTKLARALRFGFISLPADIGLALAGGLLAAAAISAALPEDYFASLIGTGVVGMLVMMAAGIPVYVCATASVPVAAALMAKGVSPGAALVFLMTGPVTNAAAFSTIWKILGRRTALVYLLSVGLSALLAGFLLDAIAGTSATAALGEVQELLPEPVEIASVFVLAGVLVFSGAVTYRARRRPAVEGRSSGEVLAFRVMGLRCEVCAMVVKRALEGLEGVSGAGVNLETGSVTVEGTGLDRDKVAEAVKESGFEADFGHDHADGGGHGHGPGQACCGGER